MKQVGNWLLILLLLLVAFFAYRKYSDKKAAVTEASPVEQSIGPSPNESRVAPGGKPRGGPGPGSVEGPRVEDKEDARRGGARPSPGKEKIDPEKKRKLLQGQSVF